MSISGSAVILIAALGLSACASVGNQVLAEVDPKTVSRAILDGKSTKAGVQETFGDPMDTTFTENGSEIWKYSYAYATPMAANFIPVVGIFAGGSNVQKRVLTILFNKSGVVMNHSMTSSDLQFRRGG